MVSKAPFFYVDFLKNPCGLLNTRLFYSYSIYHRLLPYYRSAFARNDYSTAYVSLLVSLALYVVSP
jgi:hypothetical protein